MTGDLVTRRAVIEALIKKFRSPETDNCDRCEDECRMCQDFIIENAIDAVMLVRPEAVMCEKCKHAGEKINDGKYWCNYHGAYMYYCSDAEWSGDETD